TTALSTGAANRTMVRSSMRTSKLRTTRGCSGERSSLLASRPPVAWSHIRGLPSPRGAYLPVTDRTDGVLFGPFPQGAVHFVLGLADQALHDAVSLPFAHEVPGWRDGRLSPTFVGGDTFVGHEMQLAPMQRDAVLLQFVRHSGISGGRE